MTYMAKTPSPRVKKTKISKDFLRIDYQSIYNHPVGHRYDFHGTNARLAKLGKKIRRLLSSSSFCSTLVVHTKNCGVTRLRPIIQMIVNTATKLFAKCQSLEVAIEDLVVGAGQLSAGDMIPADLRS